MFHSTVHDTLLTSFYVIKNRRLLKTGYANNKNRNAILCEICFLNELLSLKDIFVMNFKKKLNTQATKQ